MLMMETPQIAMLCVALLLFFYLLYWLQLVDGVKNHPDSGSGVPVTPNRIGPSILPTMAETPRRCLSNPRLIFLISW